MEVSSDGYEEKIRKLVWSDLLAERKRVVDAARILIERIRLTTVEAKRRKRPLKLVGRRAAC
jgi:hypothetical protein